MKKTLATIALILGLVGCDVKDGVKSNNDYTPEYVNDAKSDLRNAIISNLIRNPDFECNSLMLSQQVYWFIGCFIPDKNPMPFLLFEVHSDPSESNPPFKYRLVAINGKAKQYADNPALRFLKVDTTVNSSVDIEQAISDFVEAYPAK